MNQISGSWVSGVIVTPRGHIHYYKLNQKLLFFFNFSDLLVFKTTSKSEHYRLMVDVRLLIINNDPFLHDCLVSKVGWLAEF